MQDFKVVYRNPGHWDILSNDIRIFKIRGERGDYTVSDQTYRSNDDKPFYTINACMSYICDLLMYEPIA